MASCELIYDCPACQASSRVVVLDLPEPTANISRRTQESLVKFQAIKERLGAPAEDDPVDKLATEVLESVARIQLKLAICPRCDAKNPAGVAAQASEDRTTRIVTAVVCAALSLGSWFYPAIAFVLPAIFVFMTVFLVVITRAQGKAIPWRGFAVNFVMSAACMTVAIAFPRAAAALPLAYGIWMVVHRSSDPEAPWKVAARSLRFEVESD